MKKLPFLFLIVPGILFAEGPRFKQKDSYAQQEFENVYQDLRSLKNDDTLVHVSSPTNVSGQGLKPMVTGLMISSPGTKYLHLGYKDIVMSDNSGNLFTKTQVGAQDVINNDCVGANCLDTGLVKGDTWYYVWAIASSTMNEVDGLLSLSYDNPVMPAGYTYKLLLGAVWCKSTNLLFRNGTQLDDTFYNLDSPSFVYGSATSGVVTSVDVSSVCPPILCWNLKVAGFITLDYSDAAMKAVSFSANGNGATPAILGIDSKYYQDSTAYQVSLAPMDVMIWNEAPYPYADFIEYDFERDATNLQSAAVYLYGYSFRIRGAK